MVQGLIRLSTCLRGAGLYLQGVEAQFSKEGRKGYTHRPSG